MKTITYSQQPYRPAFLRPPVEAALPFVHVAWFAAGSALGFAVPWLFSSVLDLQHDLYYAVYFAFARFEGAAAHCSHTRRSTSRLYARCWRSGVNTSSVIVPS